MVSFAQQNDSIKKVTTTFKFGGYAKADYLYTRYNNGDVSESSPLRDFHYPSHIPVGESNKNLDNDFHVKESRFNFDISSDKFKKPIHAFIELDFLLSAQGNEIVSNSFSPRLRHFYFEYGNLLFGQTWSNFMIVVIPDDLDFSGAPEGLVFIRQPQFRITLDTWSFSVENQETTVTRFEDPTITATESGFTSDFTARKNFMGSWGNWSIATLGRFLNYKENDLTKKSFGYGITTGGKLLVGKKGNDIRAVFTYGSGLGRYVAVGYVASSVISLDDLQNVHTTNGYIAYNHLWNKTLSSSINISGFIAENDELLSNPEVNKKAFSASANLKYKPAKELLFGIEYIHANRELENSINGSFDRIQISAKYSFRYTNKSVQEK